LDGSIIPLEKDDLHCAEFNGIFSREILRKKEAAAARKSRDKKGAKG
jgi:hypothetical protein